MTKRIWMSAGALILSLGLAACSAGGAGDEKETAKEKVSSEETAGGAGEASEASAGAGASEDSAETAKAGEEGTSGDEDLKTALFRSSAYTVQMEITTGLTTEFLDGLLNYPVSVNFSEPLVLNGTEDLEKLGLEKLYTDGLLKAVGECDVDSLEIENGAMTIGDPDGANVVIREDENGNIGITEFNY